MNALLQAPRKAINAARLLCWLLSALASAHALAHDTNAYRGKIQAQALNLVIPDVPVLDQNGREIKFYSDLVKGRIVAINFIFTTCQTVCPITTSTLRETQIQLGEGGRHRMGRDIEFISVSVDPVTDQPALLKRYAAKYQAQPGWTFVTGDRPQIEKLLKAFGVMSADKNAHTPLVFIGNDSIGEWTRISGYAPSAVLTKAVEQAYAKGRPDAMPQKPVGDTTPEVRAVRTADDASLPGVGLPIARLPQDQSARYFTNLALLTHENRPVRFYDDMIRNKVVLINVMFASCSSSCSMTTSNLAHVQELLQSDATQYHMVSITIDPFHDSPDVLKEYARTHGTRKGWTFLTGKQENVDWVLYKLGSYAKEKMEHSSILLIGNDAAGVWTKALAMDNPAEIAALARKIAATREGDAENK